jgi:putative ATP-binding cassette transporter
VLVHQPQIVILDEATSALDSSNEAALYGHLRASGATLISIAHRAGVLRHHTHVLRLVGDGTWEMHEAGAYRFDEPGADAFAGAAGAQPVLQVQPMVAAG